MIQTRISVEANISGELYVTCWTEINACLTGFNCNNLFLIVPEYSQDEIRSPELFILF